MELSLKKQLLEELQSRFPVEPRPFLNIGQRLGLEEDEVLNEVFAFQNQGIIRQISAIFHPEFFSHKTGLFALRVKEDFLNCAVDVLNSHPGITHNYLRDHEYNLWFILVVLPGESLFEEGKKLADSCKAEDFMFLPALKIFKISTSFDLGSGGNGGDFFETGGNSGFSFDERDKKLVKLLQEPLPIVKEPFKIIAEKAKEKEEDIFDWIKRMKKFGALRRFGALLKHDRIGFKHNVMVAWRVREDLVEKVAETLIKQPFISHCYERKTYPHWRYNLYTMCHFKESKEEVRIFKLAEELPVEDFLLLRTLKELKKARLKLFYEK